MRVVLSVLAIAGAAMIIALAARDCGLVTRLPLLTSLVPGVVTNCSDHPHSGRGAALRGYVSTESARSNTTSVEGNEGEVSAANPERGVNDPTDRYEGSPSPNVLLTVPESIDPSSVLGFQMSAMRDDRGLSAAKSAGARWARILLPWRAIEPVEGEYDWSVLDRRMAEAADSEVAVIATFVSIPEWAGEKQSGHVVRVAPDKVESFQNLLIQLAKRNLELSYNIVYWEIFSEPDNQDPAEASHLSCAYGTEPTMYADLLKASRQALRSVDPTAKVAFGGLAMEELSERFNMDFLEQVCSVIESRGSDGSEYFDAMNIHLYPYYYITRWSQAQYGSLPGLMGKANHVRQVMLRHGIDSPILVTETSMFVLDPKPDVSQQAAYAVRAIVEGIAIGAPAVVWFTLSDNESSPGEPSGMLDRDWQPRPAYWATKYLTDKLQGASYLGPTEGLQVTSGRARGFSFSKDEVTFHVLWGEWTDYTREHGPVGGDAIVQVAGSQACLVDAYGQRLEVIEGSDGVLTVQLTFMPVYLELIAEPAPCPCLSPQ